MKLRAQHKAPQWVSFPRIVGGNPEKNIDAGLRLSLYVANGESSGMTEYRDCLNLLCKFRNDNRPNVLASGKEAILPMY